MQKECIICKKNFETKSKNNCEKTCSEDCRKKHNSNRRKKNIEKQLDTFKCKYCLKEITRYRIRSGFCSRTCASKKYIEDGTYNNWRYRIQEKNGIYKKCIICDKEFYARPKLVLNKKTCSDKKCLYKYKSKSMKENNPFRGKKEKQGTREKVKKTLMERYGINNAYELAKHTSLSKPQKEIIDFLSKNTEFTILCDFPMHIKEKCYKVDVLIKETNTIIEFNGTYWHTDPRFYKKDYFHKRKQMTAEEIWKKDEERINSLQSLGYNVEIIWEFDYNDNKEKILSEIINGKKENKVTCSK